MTVNVGRPTAVKSRSTRRRIRHMRRVPRRSNTSFNWNLWIKSRWEIVTTSLFFSPCLAVFTAIGVGLTFNYIDSYLHDHGIKAPLLLTTNVESARSLLSTVAGATISFAGTAFSVSLLVIQLGSSQYSPRIVHTLSKDPFNRRIVALVMGTFTYCLVVMRSIDSGDPDEPIIVPNVSVSGAFILGILSLLAIVAFIDHSANSMDISKLLERVTRDTLMHMRQTWAEEEDEDMEDEEEEGDTQQKPTEDASDNDSRNEETKDNPKTPKSKKGEESKAEELDDCHVVRFRTSGWVQEIDTHVLLSLVPPGGYIKVHTLAGRYAIPGAAVCSVYPKPEPKHFQGSNRLMNYGATPRRDQDSDEKDEEVEVLYDFDDNVLDAIMIGLSRTIRQDASYGLRQLVDVVLRALSPGVNDPTTAQDGIFHAAAVVTEFLQRVPPKSVMENEGGGKLIIYEQQDYDSIVRLGFDEVRICASSSPTVALYILEALRLIRESLKASGHPHRAPELERQARLLEEGIHNAKHVDEDHDFITKARRDRFDESYKADSMGVSN